jgi:allophanate hydrolase
MADTSNMANPLAAHSFEIADLHASYAKGVAATSVIDEVLRRIAVVNDPGIFISLLSREQLVCQIQGLGEFDPVGKPLWGIPFAVKDNIDVDGVETTAACPAFAYLPDCDAVCIARLKQAGAIMIGKTNLDQFATGLVGLRTPYPVPRNAVDPAIVPGGSSSGSAVAVAHRIVGFSLGTDTAGSGRVPAALNNIVGLKPTIGAISATGVVPACRTIDTISIFANTVEDAWKVYENAAAFDPADPYSRVTVTGRIGVIPPHFKVAVPDQASIEFFGDECQRQSFASSIGTLEELGAEIQEVDFAPFYHVAKLLYEGPWLAERYSVAGPILEKSLDSVHPVTAGIISAARNYSAVDTFVAQYQVKALRRELEPLLKSVFAVCVPSIPAFCTVADVESDPVGSNARLGTYTNFVNLLDMCGITFPVAQRPDGRPGSLTCLSTESRDAQMASLAVAVRNAIANSGRLADAAIADPVGDTEMELAAVGAHMSGLPLNHELTRLGARFLRKSMSAPGYRLFALAGGPPARPGMVRDHAGSQIELEVWAVPKARFGEFMCGIPAPLGIGTIGLEDGQMVKSFLCETAGLVDATDITNFGGWRAYLDSVRK